MEGPVGNYIKPNYVPTFHILDIETIDVYYICAIIEGEVVGYNRFCVATKK